MKGDERSKQQVELVDLHKGQAQTLSKDRGLIASQNFTTKRIAPI